MQRRQFLTGSLALAGLAVAPAARTLAAPGADWSLASRSVNVDRLEPVALEIEGSLPEGLVGKLYRNGPARRERAGHRHRHWFDGDGLIHRYDIADGTISHRARYVQTSKYKEEQTEGRFLYSATGTALPDSQPLGNNDAGNTANTALLPWDDEILALWEGGSAYRVDPESLETLGRRDWRDDLKHMPFSAHPIADRDGSLWNFGSAPYAGESGYLFVYRIEPGAGITKAQPIALPMASYLHSFAITERYLVFYLGAHLYERGATFVDSFRWTPDAGSKILLIDKNDLESQRWFDAPAGFVFHNAHAFERGVDVVLRTCLYSTAGIMDSGMFELMQGPSPADYPDYPRARLATITLNLRSGRTRVDPSDTLLEFPGVDPRYAGEATAVHGVGHGGGARPAYSNAIVRVDPDSDQVSRYVFPEAHIVEEPLLVEAESRDPKAGWLIGTFLDVGAGETGVYVFDAEAVDAGPVALGRMPRSVPLGFHGCFVRAG